MKPRRLVLVLLLCLCASGAAAWWWRWRQQRPARSLEAFADRETIFVSVASYRDTLCGQTIDEIFGKAKDPSRVFVGICQQNDPSDTDMACVTKPHPNVRMLEIPAKDAKGPTYARYLCSTLYDGEDHFCQLDSHMTLVDGWDELLISDLKRCPSSKPVISHYPHDVGNDFSGGVPVLCKSKFTDRNLVTLEAVTLRPPESPSEVRRIPFVAGGFMFGPGKMVREVPFDPSLDHLFTGEEILYSARLFTHGYDVFSPPRNYAHHHYGRKAAPKYWGDLDIRSGQEASQARVVRALGLDGGHPDAGVLGAYGFGTERSVSQFMAFAGIVPQYKLSLSENKFCSAA